MAKRMKSICNHASCGVLLESPGYCVKHKRRSPRGRRDNWDVLDRKKTKEEKAFYNSNRWRNVSKLYRINNPLCCECKKRNRIKPSQLVHHNPEVSQLLADGLDPFDSKYLFAICNECHLKELREKKHNKPKNDKKVDNSFYFSKKIK